MEFRMRDFFVWFTVAICLFVCLTGGVAACQWWAIVDGSYDPVLGDGEAAADVPAHLARLKMFSAAAIPAFAFLCVLVNRLSRKPTV